MRGPVLDADNMLNEPEVVYSVRVWQNRVHCEISSSMLAVTRRWNSTLAYSERAVD